MKARPILFSGPMIRALLEGRKTQTRRIVKPQPFARVEQYDDGAWYQWHDEGLEPCGAPTREVEKPMPCPYGKPGDLLWVRESFRLRADQNHKRPSDDWWKSGAWYAADGPNSLPSGCAGGAGKLRPSIHMPRWASRLTLEIVETGVEQLGRITHEDAMADGFDGHYDDHHPYYCGDDPTPQNLFNAYMGLDNYRCNGITPPWLWVIKFKVHHCNIDSFSPTPASEAV